MYLRGNFDEKRLVTARPYKIPIKYSQNTFVEEEFKFPNVALLNGTQTFPSNKTKKSSIINDTVRLITVYGVAHLLETMLHKNQSFLNEEFVLTTLYLIIGTIIYHIFVKEYLGE